MIETGTDYSLSKPQSVPFVTVVRKQFGLLTPVSKAPRAALPMCFSLSSALKQSVRLFGFFSDHTLEVIDDRLSGYTFAAGIGDPLGR